MKFATVCSGIEAASVAWNPLGWEAQFFSEIEPFPSALLAHHYGASRPLHMPDPDAEGIDLLERRARAAAIKAVKSLPDVGRIPNYGDMTTFQEWPDHAIDVLAGGTPCQAFSIAGLRAGLADPRGNLALTYLAIAAKYRPRWLVWENVPGVLSSNGGADFGSILGGMVELGYGVAYRVFDAQHCRTSGLPFAVPQRRRRVFVIGYLGDWRRAAAVLFDGASLRGDPPPRREAGQRVAHLAAPGAGSGGGDARPEDVAPTLNARTHGGGGLGTDAELGGALIPEVASTLPAGGNHGGGAQQPGISNAETAATMLIPEVANPLTARMHKGVNTTMDEGQTMVGTKVGGGAVAFDHLAGGKTGFAIDDEVAGALRVSGNATGHQSVLQLWRVRRLTPVECERLMGMPDNYTLVPFRGKPAADGPRYKGLGNSWPINVPRTIGERMDMIDKI